MIKGSHFVRGFFLIIYIIYNGAFPLFKKNLLIIIKTLLKKLSADKAVAISNLFYTFFILTQWTLDAQVWRDKKELD